MLFFTVAAPAYIPTNSGEGFPDFPCCWCPYDFEEDWGQRFYRTSLHGGLFGVPLTVALGRWMWGEDTGEGPSHPSPWGACRQHDSSLLVLTWVPRLRSCWSGVSIVESCHPLPILSPFGIYFFFFFFNTSNFRKEKRIKFRIEKWIINSAGNISFRGIQSRPINAFHIQTSLPSLIAVVQIMATQR